jgi:hypothetical protein
MFQPITDPWFFAVAIPAVIIVGLSKGGLGGLGAVFGVPILALVISPIQAAAIMLPIMVVMDVLGVWSWRANFDKRIFRTMLPGAILGVGIGWYFAASLSGDWIRILVGAIALAFLAYQYFWSAAKNAPPRDPDAHKLAGSFWGTLSGFTSFVAHAGSPPYQIHTQPMRLEPTFYSSTAICFFAAINAVKLIPYFALGQFDATNLATSAVLLPLAVLSVAGGVYLVKRISKIFFYRMLDFLLLLVALQIIWQGVSGLMA